MLRDILQWSISEELEAEETTREALRWIEDVEEYLITSEMYVKPHNRKVGLEIFHGDLSDCDTMLFLRSP